MNARGSWEYWERLQQEILEEKASALTRIGRRLRTLSERASELYIRLENGDTDCLEEYLQARARFQTYLWYWYVQREAVGFRRHPAPETWLFVPPPVSKGRHEPRVEPCPSSNEAIALQRQSQGSKESESARGNHDHSAGTYRRRLQTGTAGPS